jgi:hypothetical protein
MTTTDKKQQIHPAHAVFALMEDRQFRYSVIKPALEKDKAALCHLTTGKYQLNGFRHISKAPTVMLMPVLSDESNVSAELAQVVLQTWYDTNTALREKVAARLTELGYATRPAPFNDDDKVVWDMMKKDDAQLEFDGKLIEDEDKNAVMLMSLLLGWFGTDDEEAEEKPAEE